MEVNQKYVDFRNKKLGVDPLVDSLLIPTDPLHKQNTALYAKARDIHASETKRRYVEAALLADQDLAKICDVLGVPVDVLTMYRDLYYNVSDLDKLSKLVLVDEADPDTKDMKMWALSQGLDFLNWRLGKSVTINPVAGLQELFTLCVYKSKEALFSSGNGGESIKWAKISMDLARLLKIWVMDSGAAKKDIELALKTISPDFEGFDSLDNLPKP